MTDHFDRLGLPRRFFVDPLALERAYLALSRQVHPDFHGLGPAADRRVSEESAATVNEAYATLRSPVRRAEYLLALAGGPAVGADKGLSPTFLMEMMETRERVEAARAANAAGDLTAIEAELNDRRVAADHAVATLFDRLDETPSGALGRGELLTAVRRTLNERKTVQSLLDDLSAV